MTAAPAGGFWSTLMLDAWLAWQWPLSRRALCGVAWLLLASGASAVDDPLHTPECLQAQEALAAHERPGGAAAGAAAPVAATSAPLAVTSAPAISPRLQTLRAQVARVCLASSLDAPRLQRQLQPPLAVPPAGSVPMLRSLPLSPPLSPPAAAQRANPDAVTQRPLRSITSCDAAGCWASDGTRLQRMGPSLVGPQGVCNVSGNVASCP